MLQLPPTHVSVLVNACCITLDIRVRYAFSSFIILSRSFASLSEWSVCMSEIDCSAFARFSSSVRTLFFSFWISDFWLLCFVGVFCVASNSAHPSDSLAISATICYYWLLIIIIYCYLLLAAFIYYRLLLSTIISCCLLVYNYFYFLLRNSSSSSRSPNLNASDAHSNIDVPGIAAVMMVTTLLS